MKNITFFADNIDPRIPEMQKKVFEALGLTIHQIKPEQWEGHGGSIDGWLRENCQELIEKNETIILWDIDCIPTNEHEFAAIMDYIHREVVVAGNIVGIAQKASHIPNSRMYAGPAFLAFNIATWDRLGRPTFACTNRADCAGELTYVAEEHGLMVYKLLPTHVEEPLWPLDENIMFGKGTTYYGSIYHAFLSRKGNVEPFLKKCQEFLDTEMKKDLDFLNILKNGIENSYVPKN